jgi:hypothetical protein
MTFVLAETEAECQPDGHAQSLVHLPTMGYDSPPPG